MRGQHGAYQDGIEQRLQLSARHARRPQPRQRVLNGARKRPGRAALGLRAHATDAVLVLGNVGEMREITERAHHLDRAVVREAVEGGLELAARRGIAFPAERDRDLADALDRGKHGLALLLTDGVAEHSPDQPDVVSQRPLSVRNLTNIHRATRSVASHAAETNVAERRQIESHTRIMQLPVPFGSESGTSVSSKGTRISEPGHRWLACKKCA